MDTKRAEAIDLPEAFAIAGGIAVSPEVLGAVAVAGLACYGLYVASPYLDDFKNYVESQFAGLATSAVMDYCAYYQDSDGNSYAGLTDDGLSYVHALSQSDSVPLKSKSTTNTDSSSGSYEYNGFYMQSYTLSTVLGTVYTSFHVPVTDTLNVMFTYPQNPTYSPNTYSISATDLSSFSDFGSYVYYRVAVATIVSGSPHYTKLQYSTDGSTWYNCPNTVNISSSSTVFYFGYNTTSNTVYVPASQVLDNGDVVDVGDGTVAVPISGQYDSSNNTVYKGIEGANAGVVNGLVAKTGTNTGTGDGTGTGSDASYWSQLWDWLKEILDGVKSIPEALEGLPADIASAIGSLLQSLFVPSDTFFTDEFNKMKAPIINSFPNDLNVLNSLDDNSFEFDDIHISYSPFSGLPGIDAVIVSASTVHQYIDYIRGATSCLWVFLLLLYIWRKINYFFSGNEIIQPTIYSGHGGGGYRRSSKGDGGS